MTLIKARQNFAHCLGLFYWDKFPKPLSLGVKDPNKLFSFSALCEPDNMVTQICQHYYLFVLAHAASSPSHVDSSYSLTIGNLIPQVPVQIMVLTS